MHYTLRHVRDDEAHPRERSPLCHSTLATTRRARFQLPARYQKSSYWITGRFGGLPTGLLSRGAISRCSKPYSPAAPRGTRCPAWPAPKVPPHWRTRLAPVRPATCAVYVEHGQSELVEHEQRVIAHAPKVAVVRKDPNCPCPRSRVIARSTHVRSLGPTLPRSVEPRSRTGSAVGARSLRTTSPSNDDPHRRDGPSASLVSCSPPDDCTPLPEKAHQSVLHVTTAPTLLQTLTRLRQSQCIIQLATGQQSGVLVAPQIQPYTSVETEQRVGWCVTHWVPQGGYVIKNSSRSRPV